MSEPTTFADRVDVVVPGVVHWSVQDDRIGFRSDAYAVASPEGWILIDPLPLAAKALGSIEPVAAVCLTTGRHQRSAWSLRRRYPVPVHAPEGSAELDEPADGWYRDGTVLPGGLRAIETPGFGTVHCALVLDRDRGSVVFAGDLVVRAAGDARFAPIPDRYAADPAQVRHSIRRLVDLAPEVVCPAHGAPLVGGGGAALDDALDTEED